MLKPHRDGSVVSFNIALVSPFPTHPPTHPPTVSDGGQTMLKLHRDGSVVSFNIALVRPSPPTHPPTQTVHSNRMLLLYPPKPPTVSSSSHPSKPPTVSSSTNPQNPSSEFEGGGTYFAGLNDGLRIEQGHIVTHASNVLHGGHPITSGKRYILVSFVILEGFANWAMRFANDVWNY